MAHHRVSANAAIIVDEKILLIVFEDESGRHYNLPGGGIDPGESLEEGLQRECIEEAVADIEIGKLLLVWEYEPIRSSNHFGPLAKLGFVFQCSLKAGCTPRLPSSPDQNQIDVCWVPLLDLETLLPPARPALYPDIITQLLESYRSQKTQSHVISWN